MNLPVSDNLPEISPVPLLQNAPFVYSSTAATLSSAASPGRWGRRAPTKFAPRQTDGRVSGDTRDALIAERCALVAIDGHTNFAAGGHVDPDVPGVAAHGAILYEDVVAGFSVAHVDLQIAWLAAKRTIDDGIHEVARIEYTFDSQQVDGRLVCLRPSMP